MMDVSKRIPLARAQKILHERMSPLPAENVRLVEAGGRVLAEEVLASRDEPALTQATMDGYAVHSEDVEHASVERSIVLPVAGSVAAGQRSKHRLNRGQAWRVMTGATLPDGSDAVVPDEMTESVPQGVAITVAVARGSNLISAGSDIRRHQVLVSPSTVLQARELTVLAAQGCETVKVRRQPAVAVLATGSELKDVGGSLHKGQLFASNLYTVSYLVTSYGGIARSLDVVGDDIKKLTQAIRRGNKVDVVITTGGTGQGDKDLLSKAIDGLGGRLLFHGVAMSPGKQTLCAMIGHTLFIGLPGRPAAAYTAFQQLVRPVLLRMLGISEVFLPEMNARLRQSIQTQAKAETVSFLFSRLIIGPEEVEVESLRSRSKGMLTEMLAANSLIKVEPGEKNLEKGERVRVQLLDLGLAGLSYFAGS
jgi:molybdopterin molybdotransferase